LLLRTITEDSLKNRTLNQMLDNQVRLYENVYDQESFEKEKENV
jgi:hypothetical protein